MISCLESVTSRALNNKKNDKMIKHTLPTDAVKHRSDDNNIKMRTNLPLC